jgi:NiFe hydrogenase small subunit HydA
VSLLNSISLMSIDDLLLRTLDVKYHPNLMAAAGDQAAAAARAARTRGGYVLVVEGAIPTAAGGVACTVWSGTTALKAVQDLAPKALLCVAVGTCSSFGGVSAGKPNPTGARSLKTIVGSRPVVNIPGCPAHPDWVVGTIAYILRNGRVPPLDRFYRPTEYFGRTMHDQCPYLSSFNSLFGRRLSHTGGRSCFTCHSATDRAIPGADTLDQGGCLYALGCKGRVANCDCPTRRWNAAAAGGVGVNWCVGAKSPCIGCTEPGFPDVMSPFTTMSGPGVDDEEGGEGGDD